MSKKRANSAADRTDLDEFFRVLCTSKEGWPVVPQGMTNFLKITCADIEKEDVDVENMSARIFQTIDRITYLESKTRSLMAEYFTDPDSALIRPATITRRRSNVHLEFNQIKEMASYESMHKVARREWQHLRKLHTPPKVFGDSADKNLPHLLQ